MGNRSIVALAALCIFALPAAVPGTAAAKVKRLRPLAFLDGQVGQDSQRTPVSVANRGAVPISFFAPLVLPVGAKITGVTFFSSDDNLGRNRTVWLQLCTPGPGCLSVAGGISSVAAFGDTPVTTSLNLTGVPPDELEVDAGDRYQIQLDLNTNASVWAVDVVYTPPR